MLAGVIEVAHHVVVRMLQGSGSRLFVWPHISGLTRAAAGHVQASTDSVKMLQASWPVA